MDTHERLRQLLNERGWTEYRLAKNCGFPSSFHHQADSRAEPNLDRSQVPAPFGV